MSETFTHEDGRWLLRFERHLRHSPEKVWRVLTEPAELAHWFPAAIEGERSQGAALRFVFAGAEAASQPGVMRVFEPPRVLEYSWGHEVLRWEVVPEEGGVRLLFTHIIEDRSTAARSAAGWHQSIERLQTRLDPSRPADPSTWPDVYSRYLDRFGFGAFPAFLSAGPSLAVPGTHGLSGHEYRDERGHALLLFHADVDTDLEPQARQQEAYLLVLEGKLTLKLGGGHIELLAGREFHVPPGFPLAGRISAGTRGILGLGARGESK